MADILLDARENLSDRCLLAFKYLKKHAVVMDKDSRHARLGIAHPSAN
jgi:hypothetical protein